MNNYQKFQKSVEDFLTDYLKEKNKEFSEQTKEEIRLEFERMLDFVETHFPNGFRRQNYNTVPRIRFEAIAGAAGSARKPRAEAC